MNEKIDAFQALLAKMREDFVNEIPERCFAFEEQIFRLEKTSGNTDAFDELFRGVHSLKGAGGTHGLSVITTICHQLENVLTEARVNGEFGPSFVTQALAHVDLVRQVAALHQAEQPDFPDIEHKLETLRCNMLKNRKSILIVESSKLMAGLFRQALEKLPVQLTVMDNGLLALGRILHESFDLVIVGRELKELNGVAMMAAVRSSQMRQHDIPALLVSSKGGEVPEHVAFSANILRDQDIAKNLQAAVTKILHI